MRGRKPLNQNAAMAKGVDHLLREFRRMPRGQASPSGVGGSDTNKIDPSLFVASSTALDHVKAAADYVCDGVDDQVEINAALTQLDAAQPAWGEGGVLQLSGGGFYLSDRIYQETTASVIWIRGMGMNATTLETTGDATALRDGVIEHWGSYAKISDLACWCYHNDYKNTIYMNPNQSYTAALERVQVFMDPAVSEPDLEAAIFVTNDMIVRDVEVDAGGEGDGIYVAGVGGRTLIDNAKIRGATAMGNANGYGIYISGTTNHDCRIVNSYIDNCSVGGIITGSDNTVIIGNDADDGIDIASTADGTRIGGNIGPDPTDNGTNTVYLDNDAITAGDVSSLIVREKDFSQSGALSIGSGTIRYYTKTNRTITGAWTMVSGAPSGSPAVFDLNIDGTTAFTTQANRPEIAVAAFTSDVEVPDVTAWNAGSYLTIDVDAAN